MADDIVIPTVDFKFTGIERIVYGVQDLELGKRFFQDWGLVLADDQEQRVLLHTKDGSEIELLPHNDPALPPAFETGSTLRRVIWGVQSPQDLQNLADHLLLSDKTFLHDDEHGPSVTDPNGMRLSFRVKRRRAVYETGVPVNVLGHTHRVDTRAKVYDHAEPVKIGHVVFFTKDVMETKDFYERTLGFLVSDYYQGVGYFLRCQQEGGHHDLFLLQTPDQKSGLNHVAFTVRDIDEVFGGGIHMNQQGWETQIGPGRHPISSAYFWYVQNPCGGLAEYYTNEDYCTKNWQPQNWPRTNENYAEWAIAGGIDATTRRQVRG